MTRFHPESPDVSEEALSRLRFVADFRKYMHANLSQGNRAVYDAEVAPIVEGEPGHRRAQVRREMEASPYFRGWSSLLRTSQDLMWNLVGQTVDSEQERMAVRLKSLSNSARGSVRLDPDLETPGYFADVDTHRMPGGYMTEAGPEDLRAGGLYDLGGAIYQLGLGNRSGGLLNDSRGRTLVAHLKTRFPDVRPRRILDLGCGVGHNTVPLALAFPEAETFGLDVGAPLLRYAHLRAEGLGATVHFVQGDAEHTGFESGRFDLVTSQIILHETSPEATRRIIEESRRLLSPDGVAVHLEVPLRAENGDDYYQFAALWEEYYNGEANISGVMDQDLVALMEAAGLVDVAFGYQGIPPAGTDRSGFTAKPELSQWSHWLIVSGRAG